MNRWLVAVTVMLPTLIEIIDMSVVNVALDHIRGSLSAGIDEATWAITMYLVSNAIIIPITGWLNRYFGRKVYLNFSIALFTVSSLLCGMAWNIQSLIVFQGFSGAWRRALSSPFHVIDPPQRPFSSPPAWCCHGCLRHRHHVRPHRRTCPRWCDHRLLVMALNILHQYTFRNYFHFYDDVRDQTLLYEENQDEARLSWSFAGGVGPRMSSGRAGSGPAGRLV